MSLRKRVLVVEDEPHSCWALAELLRDDGHEVATAANAPDALAELEDFVPDVLIADLRLPGMDGVELLRHVHGRYASCRLILTSVYSEPAALQALPLEFLPKPIDPGRLRTLMSTTDNNLRAGNPRNRSVGLESIS